jgi:F420H(2)-dependent quinone reductase
MSRDTCARCPETSQQRPRQDSNLRRDPHARIVVDGHIRRVVADKLAGDAREALWQQCLAIYPGGTAYATRASARTIAVFVLRADSSRFDGPIIPDSASADD